mgnify:CR=1 FL=1
MRCKFCGCEWSPDNKFYTVECCGRCHKLDKDREKKEEETPKLSPEIERFLMEMDRLYYAKLCSSSITTHFTWVSSPYCVRS